jgi:hypothetical protein
VAEGICLHTYFIALTLASPTLIGHGFMAGNILTDCSNLLNS